MSETKTFTIDDVAKHNKKEDLYIVIHDRVYDLTKFAPDHPGGDDILLEVAGADGTEGFDDIGHSEDAKNQMKDMLLGQMEGAQLGQEQTQPAGGQASPPRKTKPMMAIVARGLGWMSIALIGLFFALVVVGLFSDEEDP